MKVLHLVYCVLHSVVVSSEHAFSATVLAAGAGAALTWHLFVPAFHSQLFAVSARHAT